MTRQTFLWSRNQKLRGAEMDVLDLPIEVLWETEDGRYVIGKFADLTDASAFVRMKNKLFPEGTYLISLK